MQRWKLLLAALFQLGLPMSAQADPLTEGRRIADLFLAGQVEAIWSASTQEMQQALGSPDDLAALRKSLLTELGTEDEILSEKAETLADVEVFTRVSRWSGTSQPFEMVISINGAGQIAGFWIRPQAVAVSTPHLDYQTKTDLRLPVRGEWFVFWGGRTIEENYHAVDPGQRFAIDLVIVRDGITHQGDPASLEAYHCWEEPILAPSDGVVTLAIDGLPDQAIGSRDAANPTGNLVVIDFGNGEYGFLAHLQQGSVRVSAGDQVKAGQEIGLCGNSGNSTEPHLHFHLQTTPELGAGEGLPAQFLNYQANGARIERGEPVRGETIRSNEWRP
ncbi:MAG: M23 family metallopeptidase [Pseudomonadota bacterium]